jgi:DNA-binding transcriptional ArsR family regulator
MLHDPADTRRAAALFKALAHPGRLEIACRLAASGPRTQKQLIDELDWPQSTVARHVAPLRACGLVEGERRGAEVWLAVRSRLVRTLVQSVCEWMQQREKGSPVPRARRTARRSTRPGVHA